MIEYNIEFSLFIKDTRRYCISELQCTRNMRKSLLTKQRRESWVFAPNLYFEKTKSESEITALCYLSAEKLYSL